MGLSFKIATRFLKSSKGQTVLIALGIAIGVSVQIFIGLLIQGLQGSLINTTIGNSPHITLISNRDDREIDNWESILADIEGVDGRITQKSVAVDGPAFIRGNNKIESVLVKGLSLERADGIYNIRERVYEGEIPSGKDEVIVGKVLKEQLGLAIGDVLTITTSKGEISEVMVRGFFDFKVATLNKTWIITNTTTAQNLFGIGDNITSIEMQVSEVFKADEIANSIADRIDNSQIEIQNWKDQNQQLLSGLQGQSISSIMIQVFVLIAVLLGIASVLAISVIQKSRQIGILKAMGIKDRVASQIFLFQGLILGLIGAVLGIALGLGLIASFTKFALNPDGTPVVDIYLDLRFILFSGAVALLSAVLASLIPARRSSKLNPIEVIKNG